MTKRQDGNLGQDDTPFHQLPGNLLATTQQWLGKAYWTGEEARALRQMRKLDLFALGRLLTDGVALRSALEIYAGENFFAPANKRIVHTPQVVDMDVNHFEVNRRGRHLEDSSNLASFQLADLKLIPISSDQRQNLLCAIEPHKLDKPLVPYSAMYALWEDMTQHQVDQSGVLIELVKITKGPVKRIFCGQTVSINLSVRGYLCLEGLDCEKRKSESGTTIEGDFLLAWNTSK